MPELRLHADRGPHGSLYVAVAATFVVMGLWHAVTWNYLAWGLWHALGVATALTWTRWRMRRGIRPAKTGWRSWWGWAPTIAFVSASYVFSTTSDLGLREALALGGRALGWKGTP